MVKILTIKDMDFVRRNITELHTKKEEPYKRYKKLELYIFIYVTSGRKGRHQ